MYCLTVDLEDWFHILELSGELDVATWRPYEPHVERMTDGLLSFLDQQPVKATFFVLGWIADTYPALVSEVTRRGHEIACHSYAHPLIHKLTPAQFENDLVMALDKIEVAAGKRPTAYRAPWFSITRDCLWAFDNLRKNGIVVDSSIFPAVRTHGGLPGPLLAPL